METKEYYELALNMWDYLYNNSYLQSKNSFPNDIQKKVDDCIYKCPLCEIYNNQYDDTPCSGCPLNVKNKILSYCQNRPCLESYSSYYKWTSAKVNSTRKKYAKQIYNLISKKYKKDFMA
jgi:hypothetical protein